ncbi:phage major tail tube protein [Campylobacter sp. 9BO]|uniref:phage major tail tube protein n=1 Tax=Campylobacter sp. 9BO TaxID=3424759 RepID=UPI003D32DD9A
MTKRQIPQVIQEANVFINGIGYLGITKNLKVPNLEFEMVEAKGALSTEYNTGMLKATEMEFKISRIDKNQFLALGLNAYSNRIPFLFKASIFQSGKGDPVPFSMAATGDFKSFEISEFESGKEIEVSIKLSAHFLDINIDNVPMMLKDVENMICLISGVDYMAKVRSNLGE